VNQAQLPVQQHLPAADLPMTAPAVDDSATLSDGEVILLTCKPSYWFIVLRRADVLVAIPIMLLIAVVLERVRLVDVNHGALIMAGIACITGVLAWLLLDRAMRSYTLTDRRVSREAGVLDRLRVELPLRKVQTVVVYQTLIERVLGVGTILISSAASGGSGGGGDISWYLIASPKKHAKRLREAIDRYGHAGGRGGAIR
jgi:uncharacterized membrane protein YdbT with pleckstrin-like domain